MIKWQLETEGGREGHISSRKPESQLVLGQFRILIRLNSFGYFYVENELIPFEELRFTIFEICGIDPTLIMYNGGDERWRLSETTRRSITVRKRICGEGTNIGSEIICVRDGHHRCGRRRSRSPSLSCRGQFTLMLEVWKIDFVYPEWANITVRTKAERSKPNLPLTGCDGACLNRL